MSNSDPALVWEEMPERQTLLQVSDLQVHYPVRTGTVKGVDRVDLSRQNALDEIRPRNPRRQPHTRNDRQGGAPQPVLEGR